MADENENQVDLSFIPESFKGEDDAYDLDGFKTHVSDLTAFKTQADEKAAALPTEAGAYLFQLGENHQLPEGFDPASMATKDEEGNDVTFDPASMIDPEDPDVALLQSAMLEAGAPADLMEKLAGIMVNREIRGVQEAAKVAQEEREKLGPDAGKARLDLVKRSLDTRMSEPEAKALFESITSAAALRAVEALIKPGTTTPAADPNKKKSLDDMTAKELIAQGLKEQMEGK